MSGEPESNGEVVEARPTKGFVSILNMPTTVDLIHAYPAVYTTLDVTKAGVKEEIFDMVNDGGENAKEYLNKSFVIKDVLIHPAVKNEEETGESIPLVRILLRTTEGQVIQTTSVGVLASLIMMKDTGWMPFGNIPQPFILKAISLNNGRQLYKLVRVKEPLPTKKK